MFVRVKPSGKYQYLQVVQNYREGAKVKQKVIGTLGRLDRLLESGTFENLEQSMLRFSQRLRVVTAQQAGELRSKQVVSIGPGLVFDRFWERMGLKQILTQLLESVSSVFRLSGRFFLLFCIGCLPEV